MAIAATTVPAVAALWDTAHAPKASTAAVVSRTAASATARSAPIQTARFTISFASALL